MKIKNPSEQTRSPGRILLYALLALGFSAAVGLPVYHALSQSSADAPEHVALSLNSLPTRLEIKPDGSVRVSFQGRAGEMHQVYYADRLPTVADSASWTMHGFAFLSHLRMCLSIG